MTNDFASGADISFYQDDNSTPQGVDFNKMKEKGDFVIIRAGQNTWLDPDFMTNWQDAKDSGIARGSYWFYDSRSTPQSQALLWANALGDDLGELPLFADFEEHYGGQYAGWSPFYGFLEELKKLMPDKEIIVYTGYYYWKDNVVEKTTDAQLEYFHQYGLWIARYGATEPLVPAPWSVDEWTFWQYTEHGDGLAYGVESLGIDLNYYNGTLAEFNARFELGEIVEPPPVEPPVEPPVVEPAPTQRFGTVVLDDLRIRDEPSTVDTNILGEFWNNGSVIPIKESHYDKDGNTWVKFEAWAASDYNGQTLIEIEEIEVPNPIEYSLVPDAGRTFVRLWRTPDEGEIHKTRYEYWQSPPQGTLKVCLDIPQYRLHMKEDGTTHLVKTWETTADKANLERYWAFVPIQDVHLSNGNTRSIDVLWSRKDGNWSLDGVFIELKNLGNPVTEVPESPAPYEFRVPTTGNFVYAQHDWDSQYWHYQPRSAKINLDNRQGNGDLPDTGKGKVDRFNVMPDDYQLLWYDACKHFAPDMHYVYIEGDFLSLPYAIYMLMADTRAITDNHAEQNGYRNVVTGGNLQDPYGKGNIAAKEMLFGGNIGNVLSETDSTYTIEALDMSKPAPTLKWLLENKPYLIGWTTTTQCYRVDDRWDGIKSAKSFPWIRDADNNRTGTPYLVTGLNGQIEMWKTQKPDPIGRKCLDIVEIANGAEYSPIRKR